MSKLGLQENEPAMLAPLDIKGSYFILVLVHNIDLILTVVLIIVLFLILFLTIFSVLVIAIVLILILLALRLHCLLFVLLDLFCPLLLNSRLFLPTYYFSLAFSSFILLYNIIFISCPVCCYIFVIEATDIFVDKY